MPELPEVEVSRLGLEPAICGRRIADAVFRTPALRHPLPPALATRVLGLRVDALLRRGKYLLFDCESNAGGGWLIIHLGMSGSLRLVAPGTPPARHDHVDIAFGSTVMRLRDPRRFGAVLWHEGPEVGTHPLLQPLGIEPLSAEFDGDWLYAALRRRHGPVKPVLMDSHLIVGIGNIYAAESLFRAGIAPQRAADRISAVRCATLAIAIRDTLAEAVAAGGSSVRDYLHSDGGAGCFQLTHAVYDRTGEPCRQCATPIRQLRQGGRSSFYCPHCQH
ncbi:bifunctional DNA-formamidopyrimidine glycosylase/DNA-(apurinic or apyrimidinic site) lyase [Rhodocyclus tenuis]|uniref:bifunctional DNA-formamidopyrimidine glycosylase/DNA-(apurinic or apyrimidinic site) lyase n=1 Tax=Rhodocyclus gracilis TaxID=2929842 RepID=UPI001298D3CD|nr:bifunctional DNA-formamidopyrimidine glycosylase/DNA-(apurinic or apyrimidinic site) lyase [Rhodocyclus gracilis]MRD72346.1 bifunctional DNA-formamidopyrimidine glycosylase/DNA-(apurinic or apyrimidinic site) lyase [Rhodocyclus gracilis]